MSGNRVTRPQMTGMALPKGQLSLSAQCCATEVKHDKDGKKAREGESQKTLIVSCHRLRGNEVRLWLSVIAYNLGNLWRRLALPKKIGNWSLTSLQQRLIKTGGRLVKHARYYWLLLAEGHLTRERFGSMLRRIAALPLPNE
jgi:Transposase DDE domain group 1